MGNPTPGNSKDLLTAAFAYRLRYGLTPEQVGVSTRALGALATAIRALEDAPPEILDRANGRSEASSDARRLVRFLCTLAPDDLAERDLAAFVWWLLGAGRTRFSIELIQEVLFERRHTSEAHPERLREIARLVRYGASRREAAAATGSSQKLVDSVTGFLGCVEARKAAIPDEALAAVDHGGVTVDQFAERFRISKAAARAELEEAARVLELEPAEVVA